MKKEDLRVDDAVVDYLEQKYQITLDMLSMSDNDRARIDGAWEVILLLKQLNK